MTEAEQSGGDPAEETGRAGRAHRGRFLTVLALCFVLHRLLVWALEATHPARGEPLALRWLRALAEHPVRGPLGLALALLAAEELLRAVLNRPRRT